MRDRTVTRDRNASNWGWIAGAIVVLLLLGAVAYSWNNNGSSNSASNNSGASAPASTTGSAPARAPASNAPPASAPAR